MSRATRRSMAGRIGMACYAVWIVLALSMLGAAPCPTHDGPAGMAAMMATMPASASMPGMAHSGSDHGSRHGSHGAHHTCTCVGCGCCAAMLDLCAPARTLVPAPVAIARGTTAPLPPQRVAASGADRRLPFANGPPAGVIATA